VLVHDEQSPANVEAIVNPILSAGGVARAIAADISTANGRQQLARHTRGIVGDRLDTLVLNVSCSGAAEPPRDSGEVFDEPASSSERAPFLLIERLLPILSHGSSVIFMYPADATTRSVAESSPQQMLGREIRQLADAFRSRGIRVNGVEIARARTGSVPAGRSRRADDLTHDRKVRRRFNAPRPVGAVIGFLASNESSEITGVTLRAHMSANAGRGRTVGEAVRRSWQ
jgi:NAD(P)-dependent dehydrogenase (short-subunit alcohol dehydrogenase family)